MWASTGTKGPEYSDVKYVDALIGPDTINTLPLETLNAYRDHGQPLERLLQGIAEAKETLKRLNELEIDLEEITQRLETEGVRKFIEPFDRLIASLQAKHRG